MIKTVSAESIHSQIVPKLKAGATLMEALVEYSAEHQIDIEELAEVLKKSSVLKAQLWDEAVRLKMVVDDNPVATIF